MERFLLKKLIEWKNSKYRKSHENPAIKKLYKEYLEKPGSDKAHELLHTTYNKREKYIN